MFNRDPKQPPDCLAQFTRLRAPTARRVCRPAGVLDYTMGKSKYVSGYGSSVSV